MNDPPLAYNPEDYLQFEKANMFEHDDEYSPGKKLSTVSEDRTNEAMSESYID